MPLRDRKYEYTLQGIFGILLCLAILYAIFQHVISIFMVPCIL
jgi:hypothetical protein